MLSQFLAGCLWAADKNGVSPGAISVPKGPGSVEGLGESFQPSLNTGTAGTSFSLQMPPGVGGHQPALRFRYEGGGGNGSLGYGWSLSLPRIQRRTDKGIPTYGQVVGIERPDTFINEMKEELVPQADGFFFCENEGAFIRYRQVKDHWEGTLPNGTKLEFGVSASGRIEESTSNRTFCWMLQRETDTHGNTIEYVYDAFPNEANLNQKYLTLVRYGPGSAPWSRFHFAVFDYEDRPDWFEDGRSGFLIRTGKRLKRVVIGTQGADLPGHLAGDFDRDGFQDFLNRRYELSYLRYAGADSHWSLLERITLVGADGTSALPPATYSYAVSDPPSEISAGDHLWSSLNEPAAVMDNSLVELIDLNADGLPDLLRTDSGGGAHSASVNLGPGQAGGRPVVRWAAPVAVDPGDGAAWNFDLGSTQTHLADMDGDGLADLVHTSADNAVFFFANRGKLSWGTRQDMAVQDSLPPAPFGRQDVRTADIDFDKRIDIIQSIDVGGAVAYRVWFNLEKQQYSPPFTVTSETGSSFALSGVHLADCNGDRVPDIASVQATSVRVGAGLGYARFAESRRIPLPDITLDEFQIAQAKLIDINGDGLADLVLERATPGECWFWINLGNYSLSLRKRVIGLPPAWSVNTAVRWADLNGNGTTDLIYADSLAVSRLQMIDLGELINHGLVPNLLTRIENGIGRMTSIEYASSTQFALEDAVAGTPWTKPLPFPIAVVAGVRLSDSLGHEYLTRFRYHDGYYDPIEKQFRGFGRAEQIDVGDPTAPTLVTRSFFDTGETFEAMKGKLLRVTVGQEDGKVFSDTTITYTSPPVSLMTGTNGQKVTYVHPTGQRKRLTELGQGTERTFESEVAYDHYGNIIRQADYGVVEGTNRLAFHDERISVFEYALNFDNWMLRAVKRAEVQAESGAVISRTETYFDDETFSGSNFGQISVGNVTLTRVWIDPSKPDAFIDSVRAQYDKFGNAILTLDPLAVAPGGAVDRARGHVREILFDEDFHTYATQEIVHIGEGRDALLFRAKYDFGLATMLQSSDFNENQSGYAYDAFARQTKFIKPGDSPEFPSAEYDYSLAVPVPLPPERGTQGGGIVNFVESRQLDKSPGSAGPNKRDHYLISRAFTDGLGRPLMSKQEAEPAAGSAVPRVVISGAVVFNARQKPKSTLNPCFSLKPGETLDQLLDFESVEAPGWRGTFELNGQLTALDLTAAHQTSVSYDATLRPVKTVNPDGTFSRTVYEPLITRAYDENDTDAASPYFDTPLRSVSDGLGRLVRVEETARLNDDGSRSPEVKVWSTVYDYDLNDNLIRITDAQGNVKTMEYDSLKRKISMRDPDCGTTFNTYDAASNLMETTDAKGQRITFTYDGANRKLTEDFHDDNSTEFSYHRTPDVVYHYDTPAPSFDPGDGTFATAHNTKGMLAYVEDVTGDEHTSFNARGNVEWTVKRIVDPRLPPASGLRNPSGLISFRTALEYDASDRVTAITYPDGDQLAYEYNARGTVQSVSGGPSGRILGAIQYLPSGQQSQVDYGNGVRSTSAYDSRLRLTSLVTRHPSHDTPLINFGYDFDSVSNVRRIEDRRPISFLPVNDPRRNTQTFSYDDLYRLTRVQYNSPSPSTSNGGELNYRYDRIGNMLEQASNIAHLEKGVSVTDLGTMSFGGSDGSANRTGRQPGDPPGPHALTSARSSTSEVRQYPYDANGSVTKVDGLHCTWDFKNRLVTVEDDTTRADYRYDHSDRRITKCVTGKQHTADQTPLTTLYVTKSFEVRDHDQPIKYVFHGGTRVARVSGSLSSKRRTQRIRVYAGWNLIALAVTAPTALRQLSHVPVGQEDVIQSVFRWDPATRIWHAVAPEDTMPAGTVLWVRASTPFVLSVTGTFSDTPNQSVGAGGYFVPNPSFEVVPLLGDRAAIGPEFAMWHFDAASQRWQARLPSIPDFDPDFPDFLAAGAAVFIGTEVPAELTLPDRALQVRYYHQDHLGSSSAITDAEGALVEEAAYYPFGGARNEYRPRNTEEFYKFIQKERDRESGLDYVEARFLSSVVGRFLSVDPKYANIEASTADPQQLNLYAYARNNPILYVDSTGLDFGIPELAESLDEIDFDLTAKVVGEALGSTWVGAAIKAPPGVSDVASFSGGFGDAIIDPMAKFAGVQDLGMGFGRFTRMAFGINSVNTSSPDYHGGHALSTMLQFAVGIGEAKAAVGAGELVAAKNTSSAAFESTVRAAAGPTALGKTAVPGALAKTEPALVSKSAGTFASVSGDAARAASIAGQRLDAYKAILAETQRNTRVLVPHGLHPSLALRMAFNQADAIWVSRTGLPPPGAL